MLLVTSVQSLRLLCGAMQQIANINSALDSHFQRMKSEHAQFRDDNEQLLSNNATLVQERYDIILLLHCVCTIVGCCSMCSV